MVSRRRTYPRLSPARRRLGRTRGRRGVGLQPVLSRAPWPRRVSSSRSAGPRPGRAMLRSNARRVGSCRGGPRPPPRRAPGVSHASELTLNPTSNLFMPGHRIRLDVSMSGGGIAGGAADRSGETPSGTRSPGRPPSPSHQGTAVDRRSTWRPVRPPGAGG